MRTEEGRESMTCTVHVLVKNSMRKKSAGMQPSGHAFIDTAVMFKQTQTGTMHCVSVWTL